MSAPELKLDSLQSGPVSWGERLRRYALLVRLNRPIGILLLLLADALGAVDGGGGAAILEGGAGVFICGVTLMRSAGCAINDFADRHIDGRVERTKLRPIAAGLVSPKEALGVFAALSLSAFALLFFLNHETKALSLVALLLAAVYPFMKRYTHLPQVVLGAAFGWAVPMAFMAIQQQLPPSQLGAVQRDAAVGADLRYPVRDGGSGGRSCSSGVKSTAILFGRHDLLIIGLLQLLMLGLLGLAGAMAGRGWIFFLGVAAGAGFFVYQQWITRDREPKACFEAFLNNNNFGLVVFVGLLLDYLLLG